MSDAAPIVPILEVAGLRGERYGLGIVQRFIVPLRLENGEWRVTGQIPRKLAEYLPTFIQQHDPLIERLGMPDRAAVSFQHSGNVLNSLPLSPASESKGGSVDAPVDTPSATVAAAKKPIRTKPVGVLGTPKARSSKPPSRKKVV